MWTARAVFEETGRYLGMVCANLMNLLNPQAIVIGGGVMAAGDLLLDADSGGGAASRIPSIGP